MSPTLGVQDRVGAAMTGERYGEDSRDLGLWLQSACTVLVALGAAYASYRHGRDFALRFGADGATATIWPLIVDGLLTIATVELWRAGRERTNSGRWVAWLAFSFGIGMSLCANIAAAPDMNVLAVIVAACPPLALLLSVELLNGALKRHTGLEKQNDMSDAGDEPAADRPAESVSTAATAEKLMWEHYQHEVANGRAPTGAELDRVAGTNNYGRKLLRRWRDAEVGSEVAVR